MFTKTQKVSSGSSIKIFYSIKIQRFSKNGSLENIFLKSSYSFLENIFMSYIEYNYYIYSGNIIPSVVNPWTKNTIKLRFKTDKLTLYLIILDIISRYFGFFARKN